jgi:hypothetical protein
MCKAANLIMVLVLGVMAAFSANTWAASVPEAKPDKGLVVFYRKNLFAGKAIRFNINHPEGTLGQLLAGTMLYKYVKPGDHTFTAQSPSIDGQDSITINAKAGKVYYVRGEVLVGWPAGRTKFVQMSDAEAKADLADLNKK